MIYKLGEANVHIELPYLYSENYLYLPAIGIRSNKNRYPYLYMNPKARELKEYIKKEISEILPDNIKGMNCKEYIATYTLISEEKRYDITNMLKLIEDSVLESFDFLDDRHAISNTIRWKRYSPPIDNRIESLIYILTCIRDSRYNELIDELRKKRYFLDINIVFLESR